MGFTEWEGMKEVLYERLKKEAKASNINPNELSFNKGFTDSLSKIIGLDIVDSIE